MFFHNFKICFKKIIIKIGQFEDDSLKFREVNGIFYFPELVPGSKSTFTTWNFTFSVHVAIWW